MAWRLAGIPAGARAVGGMLFGVGLFGPTLFWISEFHQVGYVLLIALESSFFAVAFAAVPPTRRALAIALPGAVVLAEVARGAVPFGGLPMGGIALGQAAGPLAPAARIGGASLVAALVVVLALSLLTAAAWRQWRVAIPLALIAIAAPAAGLVAPDGRGSSAPRRIRVAIVQGGGDRGFRAVDSDPRAVLDAHLAISRNLAKPLDLVLWPENTIDVPAIVDSAEGEALAAVARRLDATLVAGVTEDVEDDRFQNVAVAWSPNGSMIDRYIKVHRVPFGEYVPMRGLLERIVDLSVLPRDAVSGKGAGVLTTPAGRFGVAISYEVFFSDRSRAAMRGGGELLLVPTNAASFTSSQVPTQEVAASRLRGWETGRWVLQSAPTGYSAIVDPRGRVLARSTLSRAEILAGRAELRTGKTIYVLAGDAPVVVVAALLVGLGWLINRRDGSLSRSSPASEHSASES